MQPRQRLQLNTDSGCEIAGGGKRFYGRSCHLTRQKKGAVKKKMHNEIKEWEKSECKAPATSLSSNRRSLDFQLKKGSAEKEAHPNSACNV